MNNLINLRESDLKPKEEGTNGGKNISPKPKLTTSSWTKLKDPRIVRVSRAFGGKDRHSKVCTVRGLRDRRVRLSVPTAIQLYDLQDRLGLNQPSKVVDWLLDVAKHEIDELPPLQMPLGFNNPSQGFQSMINVASQSQNDQGVKTNSNWEDYWNPHNKSKEKDHYSLQSSNQSSSIPMIFNNVVPYGSFLKLNPSNLSSSQFGSYGSMSSSTQEETSGRNFNINVASGSQFLMYPPPSHDHNSSSRAQFNHHQKQLNLEMLSSTSSSSYIPLSSPLYTINHGLIRPFNLSMNHKLFPSEENEQDEGNRASLI